MYIVDTVKQTAEPIVKEFGLDLWDVEFKKEGSSNFLRIFLDKPEGITLDDCQIMSKAISDELDKTDPIKEPYYLEVSSPGLDRPLKNHKDFKRNINRGKVCGQKLSMILKQMLEIFIQCQW